MITLNTILYEENFREILSPESWIFNFKSDLITGISLTVNNILSDQEFLERSNSMKEYFDFDLIWVEENSEKAKEKFNLKIDIHTLGYYYTIPYFVMIDKIKTKYVLNVASDCMEDIFINEDFLIDSIKELESNPLCSSTMVSWVKNNRVIENGKTVGQNEHDKVILNKTIERPEKFTYSLGFTDQFFFAELEKLRNTDYNLDSIYSESYGGPSYGGNCFEKRIIGNQTYRGIYNCIYNGNDYYIHDGRYY